MDAEQAALGQLDELLGLGGRAAVFTREPALPGLDPTGKGDTGFLLTC